MHSPVLSRAIVLLAITAGGAVAAEAQTRFTVEEQTSLAWWQVDPHMNHLWATTCPAEPSWRPGEGRSAGWAIGGSRGASKQGYAAVSDTSNIPLYTRPRARALCAKAVVGEMYVADTVDWSGVRGKVTVRADSLYTGETRRDAYTREAILNTNRYQNIEYIIDSVVHVTRNADTIHGTAIGLFSLTGKTKPMRARISAWPEAGGLRVLAKLRIPAFALTDEWALSKTALGLGVTASLWHDLYMGVDLLMRSTAASGAH